MTRQAPRPTVHFPIGSTERSWKGNGCFEPGVLIAEGPIREFFSDGPLTLERTRERGQCASDGRGTRLLFRYGEFVAWRHCNRSQTPNEKRLVLGMVAEMRARV